MLRGGGHISHPAHPPLNEFHSPRVHFLLNLSLPPNKYERSRCSVSPRCTGAVNVTPGSWHSKWLLFFFSGSFPVGVLDYRWKGESRQREKRSGLGFDVWKVCEVAAWHRATNLPPDWKRKLLEVGKVVRRQLFISLSAKIVQSPKMLLPLSELFFLLRRGPTLCKNANTLKPKRDKIHKGRIIVHSACR